jgi:excisionase family DNA binding protein
MKSFDVSSCADFLNVHANTILTLAASGELPGAKIGRSWVFLEDDVVGYVRKTIAAQADQRAANEKVKPILSRRTRKSRRNPTPELPDFT